MTRTLDYFRTVDDTVLADLPFERSKRVYLHRVVEDLRREADFDLIRPDWLRLQQARQGSE